MRKILTLAASACLALVIVGASADAATVIVKHPHHRPLPRHVVIVRHHPRPHHHGTVVVIHKTHH